MLVVCPLKSITEDQVVEVQTSGILAALAADISNEELQPDKFQLIIGSAEMVMEGHFLNILSDNTGSQRSLFELF